MLYKYLGVVRKDKSNHVTLVLPQACAMHTWYAGEGQSDTECEEDPEIEARTRQHRNAIFN